MSEEETIEDETGKLVPLSIEELLRIRATVNLCKERAMVEGTHYGSLGRRGQDCLLLPGAQLLAQLFKLSPEYTVTAKNYQSGGHRDYEVKCILKPIKGAGAWEGVGMCSTLESKYRYTGGSGGINVTSDKLPGTYWAIKQSDGDEAAKAWLSNAYDGAEAFPKRIGEGWVVAVKGGGQVENPNVGDALNTVLKIAKKRAFVDAVISATACNDLFTQDLEDMEENKAAVKGTDSKQEKPKPQEKKTEDKSKSCPPAQPQEPKPKPKQVFTGWRGVEIELDKRSTLNGKQLGECSPTQLKMIERILGQTANHTDQQTVLLEAVKEGLASPEGLSPDWNDSPERNSSSSKEPGGEATEKDSAPPGQPFGGR